jgi:Ricin-type beta-trefoil lectin domain-like
MTRIKWTLGLLAMAVAALATVFGTAGSAQAKPGPFYYIVAEHSGKALMPENHSKDPGVRIVQMPKANVGAQHWLVRHVDNLPNGQTIRKFENRNSHLCITIINHGAYELLTQDQCETGGWYRDWVVSSWSDLWAERPVKIWSHEDNLCMDVYGAYTDDYTPVGQYACHSGPNQSFHVEYVPGT